MKTLRVLSTIAALYLGVLYVSHQAHPCYVVNGRVQVYAAGPDDVRLCTERPWYRP